MTNRDVARNFLLLGKIMELHGENPFKIRSYTAAYNTIRKLPYDVVDKSKEELQEIKGIGKAISEKIIELKETGRLKTLDRYLEQTPSGVVEMLQIKGLGPKKVETIWKNLGIETPGELLYACNENRLIELKGFGAKTQEEVRKQMEYYLDSKGKYLYGHIIEEAEELLSYLSSSIPGEKVSLTGEIRRKMPEVEGIDLLTTANESKFKAQLQQTRGAELVDDIFRYKDIDVTYAVVAKEDFDRRLFWESASPDFMKIVKERFTIPDKDTDKSFFSANKLAFIPPESREDPSILKEAAHTHDLSLLEYSDIRGVIHAHSTWSDGSNTLREMAEACRLVGYEYLVISDHSKAAFYANGLTEERVLEQIAEIDEINSEYDDFKIFKGIECDILSDGSLDYGNEFLGHFELVIASVHTNLKMDRDKANYRLLRAISNPHTRILGHPTGRLLLSRKGYPIDHRLIIDACAEYDVVIEINANPYRLDLDWTWIPYAREKGVMLSINPDAHSISGIGDIRFGVDAARKGLLRRSECLNVYSRAEFMHWLNNS